MDFVFRINTDQTASVNQVSQEMHFDFVAQLISAKTSPVDQEPFATIPVDPTSVSALLERLAIHILKDASLFRNVEKTRTALKLLCACVIMETLVASLFVTMFNVDQTPYVHSETIRLSASVDLVTMETPRTLFKAVHLRHHHVDPILIVKGIVTATEASANHHAKAMGIVDRLKSVLGTSVAILVILLQPAVSILFVKWPSTARAALAHLDSPEMLMLSVSEVSLIKFFY